MSSGASSVLNLYANMSEAPKLFHKKRYHSQNENRRDRGEGQARPSHWPRIFMGIRALLPPPGAYLENERTQGKEKKRGRIVPTKPPMPTSTSSQTTALGLYFQASARNYAFRGVKTLHFQASARTLVGVQSRRFLEGKSGNLAPTPYRFFGLPT